MYLQVPHRGRCLRDRSSEGAERTHLIGEKQRGHHTQGKTCGKGEKALPADTFSQSLANEAGESSADNGGKSGGTRQSYFESQFQFTSTTGSFQAKPASARKWRSCRWLARKQS